MDGEAACRLSVWRDACRIGSGTNAGSLTHAVRRLATGRRRPIETGNGSAVRSRVGKSVSTQIPELLGRVRDERILCIPRYCALAHRGLESPSLRRATASQRILRFDDEGRNLLSGTLQCILECLARRELHCLRRRDLNFGAGRRVATDARRACGR